MQRGEIASTAEFDPSGLEAIALLRSLFASGGECVLVDGSSRILAANPAAAARILSDSDEPANGLGVEAPPLSALCGAVVSDQWARLVDRAATEEGPICTVGMLRGRWTLASFRHIPDGAGGPPLVLVLSRPAREEDEPWRLGVPRIERSAVDDLGPLSSITAREAEVLRLIGLSYSASAIADELHRSVKTVQGHRNSLGHKLSVSNRVDLALIAIRSGLTLLTGAELRETWRRARPGRGGGGVPDEDAAAAADAG